MPVADKCREIYCSAIKTSNANCRTVEVDRASNICNEWSTLQHTIRPWSRCIVNLPITTTKISKQYKKRPITYWACLPCFVDVENC
ncbi:hypothetical protein TNCV_4919011 [Trichonephila clavipes]|nr:hypothetical protein TNCV_4919011 [Trichonephila clavipes]